MSLPDIAALVFTVVLLFTTAYFLLGGLPLLVLRHDSPIDARFVQGFFTVYYRAAFVAAAGAAVSYALGGRPWVALSAAGVVLVVATLRRRLIPAMVRLGQRIQSHDTGAVRAFRRVHAMALAVNAVLIALVVWSLSRISP